LIELAVSARARRLGDIDQVLLDLLADEGRAAGKRAELVFVVTVLYTGDSRLGKWLSPVGPTICYSGRTNFSV
jgi:hypothetical protein